MNFNGNWYYMGLVSKVCIQMQLETQRFFCGLLLEILLPFFVCLFVLEDFMYLFLEGREGREKKRERNIDWLSLTHALTKNRTDDLSVCRMTPNPLSHTSQV